jgi:6-pyruvoyl-tetrahydropterin synthase
MPAAPTFDLRLAKEDFHFSAAHFCALGAAREGLHGHNSPVAVGIRGAASADGFVIDFSEVKAAVRALCR